MMTSGQGPASQAHLDRRGPERAGHRGRGHPQRLRGGSRQRRSAHQPPARRCRSLHRGPGHDTAGRLVPPVAAGSGRRTGRRRRAQRPPVRPDGPLRRRPAGGLPRRIRDWRPVRPGQVGRWTAALRRRRRPPRAFTIRRSKHEGSSSCSRCSSPSSPPGGWSAPGRRPRRRCESASAELRRPAGADGAPGGPGRPRPGNRGT